MAIIKRKPVTPGQRGMTVNRQKGLSKNRPIKALTQTLKRHSGRDRFGRISIRHRGGGAKRIYRVISSLEKGQGSMAEIVAIEYDPNRSANIALVKYENNDNAYILASSEMKVGQKLEFGDNAPVEPGNRIPLKKILRGIAIYDIALAPERSGQMVKSAGSSAVVTAHEDDGRYVQIKLPSGEIRRVISTAYASIGTVSNPDHNKVVIGKAGRKRYMGWRPSVRGKAMNPDDHPHGGGEGSSPIGLKHPKTPWGKPALGYKTRKNKRTDKFIIKRRSKKRRG